jgi:hypothetical protein
MLHLDGDGELPHGQRGGGDLEGGGVWRGGFPEGGGSGGEGVRRGVPEGRGGGSDVSGPVTGGISLNADALSKTVAITSGLRLVWFNLV